MSSARSRGFVNLDAWGRSYIYNINNKGLTIEPWGTPHLLICLDKQEVNNCFEWFFGYENLSEILISKILKLKPF